MKQKIIVHHRRYSHKKECYDPNTDLGDEAGMVSINILRYGELVSIQEEIQLASKIEEIYLDSTNEHLLSFHTDTKAPRILKNYLLNQDLFLKYL